MRRAEERSEVAAEIYKTFTMKFGERRRACRNNAGQAAGRGFKEFS